MVTDVTHLITGQGDELGGLLRVFPDLKVFTCFKQQDHTDISVITLIVTHSFLKPDNFPRMLGLDFSLSQMAAHTEGLCCPS